MLQLDGDLVANVGWKWSAGGWQLDGDLVAGLEHIAAVSTLGKDAGVRLRDVDNDGNCEVIFANDTGQGVLHYNTAQRKWIASAHLWPKGVGIVDRNGQDAGVRFVDLNQDCFHDIFFSNGDRSSIFLWNKAKADGWTSISDASKLPAILRSDGANNGVWFRDGYVCAQNENTLSFDQLAGAQCVDTDGLF